MVGFSALVSSERDHNLLKQTAYPGVDKFMFNGKL